MAAAYACQPLFCVRATSVTGTGKPASRCAVSSTLAPFCPKADPQTPVNASANATWQIARRFKSPKKFLGFTGVLLPHSQSMSKTRVGLSRRRDDRVIKLFVAKKQVRTGLQPKIEILANNIIQRLRIKSGRSYWALCRFAPREPSSMARLRFVPSADRSKAV